ncbi:MAG: hypothetical protein NUW02_03280 [Candidatus Campbellbacteria bacterium]|nr:hypothetical protein [Candidatus Campbellbacteria bacterium]
MNEKDLPKIIGALLSGVVLFILMTYMGVTNGFLKILVVVLLLLSFFSDRFGNAGKKLRTIFSIATAVVFLLSWGYTAATATWGKHELQVAMPREIFNSESPLPKAGENPTTGATSKFIRLPDGTLKPVPLSWKRDQRTGLEIPNPGTVEYWNQLNEYNAQEARKTTTPVEYRFCWSKPKEVKGYRPDLRQKCLPMRINAWSGGYINISVFHLSGGETKEQVYSMNRPEGTGTWKNTDGSGGHGVWEELPLPEGTNTKMLGRLKDETQKDDGWFSFVITPKSTTPSS